MLRYYTKNLKGDVFSLFSWKKVVCTLHDKTEIEGEFPSFFSQSACNIIADKYFKKAGLPTPTGGETSVKQIYSRMVSFWTKSALDDGIILEEEADEFRDECLYMLCSQIFAPNSPQWFNTGIKEVYGVEGNSDNNYYYDETLGEIVKSKDKYSRTQASACFISHVEDSLLGEHSISEQYVTETKLFKGGSGIGTNYSNIRSKGEKLSGGGESSGLMSFLYGLDRNAGAIKSGGSTRRAAKMVVCNVDHPEIMEFINWKAHEEKKARDLVKMGYTGGMDGEAYLTVSGQNSNNSVRVSRVFMKNVENTPNESYVSLKRRTDNSVVKKLLVGDVWDNIAKCAWYCGDPGLQYDDLFNSWMTCPIGYDDKPQKINSTNPCGEFAFIDNSSCNLASINLMSFYDGKTFNLKAFRHVVDVVQIVLEASNHWGQFPTKDIAYNTYMYRPNGLGVSNLASLLIMMGLSYDSDEARAVAGALISILTGQSYITSAYMAERVGPFKMYDKNKKYMQKVIKMHATASGVKTEISQKALDKELGYSPYKVNHKILKTIPDLPRIIEELNETWTQAIVLGEKYGYRNAQVSLIAPTGTISFAMDCASASVEPFFSHKVYKKLSGGGSVYIANPNIDFALRKLGYSEESVPIIADEISNGNYDNVKDEHKEIFYTTNDISYQGHIAMVAALTPLISGSVSKTINMPYNSTVEDIKDAYLYAYKMGVKAITVYRDGSKIDQPLQGVEVKKEPTYQELLDLVENKDFTSLHRRRPDGIRQSNTHSACIQGVELYVHFGYYPDGKIAEIFITTDKEGTPIKGLLATLSKSFSNMLQYGISPEKISSMLRGEIYEPSGFVSRHPYIKSASSISDLISKMIDIELGVYDNCNIKPETAPITKTEKDLSKGQKVYGRKCSSCGSSNMVKIGTCYYCQDCGETSGCS